MVLHRPELFDLVGDRRGIGVSDAIRESADAVSIYAFDPDRPYIARVRVQVRVRLARRLLIWWLLSMIALASTTALILPEDRDLVDSLALLTFPLTLAGAVVLARDTSALAERLQQRWRRALALAIVGLWCITLSRLLLNGDVSWAENLWVHVKGAAESLGRRLPFRES